MKLKQTYTIIIFLIGCFCSFSQESTYHGNPDDSFMIARDLAFKGKRVQARDTLKQILSKYPEYTDVHTLLAKTYSWDKKYDTARKEFNKIISREKEIKEVWISAVNNELYAKNPYIALGLANKALLYIKHDKDLLLLKTKALAMMGEEVAAIELLKAHTNKYPNDILANTFLQELKENTRFNSIGASISMDVFDAVFDPMTLAVFDYKRNTKYGSIIGSVTYANRFGYNGMQYGLEVYPKVSEKIYLNLAYAYSASKILPENMGRAEVFVKLPKSLTASIGARHYDFNTKAATIYTGSVSLYKGDYYFSIRPYVTPVDNASPSFSSTLTARKYGKTAENFIGITLGYGFLPELRQLNVDNVVLTQTVFYLESQQIILEHQFPSKNKQNVWKLSAGVLRQELVFDAGNFVLAVSGGIQYRIKF